MGLVSSVYWLELIVCVNMQISQRTQFFPIPTSDVRLILILSGSFLTGATVMLQIIFRVPVKYASAQAFPSETFLRWFFKIKTYKI